MVQKTALTLIEIPAQIGTFMENEAEFQMKKSPSSLLSFFLLRNLFQSCFKLKFSLIKCKIN